MLGKSDFRFCNLTYKIDFVPKIIQHNRYWEGFVNIDKLEACLWEFQNITKILFDFVG